MTKWHKMPNRFLPVAVVVLAVAACSGAGQPEDARSTSTTVPVVVPGAAEYHVTYRVEDVPSGDESTEELWVRRPFDGRVERLQGATVVTTTISTLGVFASRSPASAPLVVPVRPSAAVGDLRLDVSLPDLVRARAGTVVGRGRVLGRQCTVVRFGEPIGTAALPPPTARSYADTCVDRHGIVLSEEWVEGGRTLRRRVAVAYDEVLPDDSTLFEPGPLNPPAGQGGGAFVPLGPDEGGDALWSLTDPPSGYRHLGRYRLEPTGSGVPGAGGSGAQPSVIDVYVDERGGFLVLDQGQRDDRGPRAGRRARGVDIRLPDATAEPSVTGNVVLGFPDAVRYVALTGTLPLAELVEVAGHLRP